MMGQDLKIYLGWLNGLLWELLCVCIIYCPDNKVTDYLVGHSHAQELIAFFVFGYR